MIKEAQGNLLQANAEALVNTVNCDGFMGKGIALQFKQAWPDNFKAYAKACKSGQVQLGSMFVFATECLIYPKYIINFPTKGHWRENSRLKDIASGLQALIEEVKSRGIQSIAVPPLGCGNGGLDWQKVRPMIVEAFNQLPEVEVFLYAPVGAPEAKAMPIATERPKMTSARALFVKIMDAYASLDYRQTLLEIQKLAYFLQEAGESLRLNYGAGHYGPYAPNLNKVLERIEGHFIRGYGDSQKPDIEINLLPGAVQEADKFIQGNTESLNRLEKVLELIQGFETPYGMELLSTVHWVAKYLVPPAQSADDAIQAVHRWNERKQRLFREDHIRIAHQHLQQHGWILS
jgi:O-acetyl-ADP-ribose deacetylase (regulator of RNase III)